VDAPIAVAYADCGDLFDAFEELSLPGLTGAIVVGRAIDRQRTASTSNAHLPGCPRMIHQLALLGRLQSFRRMTSCSISLSRQVGDDFLSLLFSSSS
jgi:hypothetical protein